MSRSSVNVIVGLLLVFSAVLLFIPLQPYLHHRVKAALTPHQSTTADTARRIAKPYPGSAAGRGNHHPAPAQDRADLETQQAPLPGGVYTLNFTGDGELAVQSELPLALQGDPNAFGQPVEARVEILEPEIAGELSPAGLAFKLNFVTPNESDTPELDLAEGQTPPELIIDYSQLPLRYGGDFAGRFLPDRRQ